MSVSALEVVSVAANIRVLKAGKVNRQDGRREHMVTYESCAMSSSSVNASFFGAPTLAFTVELFRGRH